MAGQVLTGADAERAFQEMTGQSSASAATTIAAKAALHDRGLISHEQPPAPDRNTGGIPTRDERGNVLKPPPRPPAARPPAPQPQAEAQELRLPDKFANAEDPQAALLKAYQELERKYSQATRQQKQAEPENVPDPQAPEPEEDDSSLPPEPAMPAFESQEAEQEFINNVVSAVGGQEAFDALAAWAPEYGDPVTVDAFNKAIDSGNADAALLAVKALRYEMTSRQGFTPTLVGGLALGSQSGPKPFNSQAELRAAMRDPRYLPGPQQDGAYVEEVQRRLTASL